jgi:hypothetical protein
MATESRCADFSCTKATAGGFGLHAEHGGVLLGRLDLGLRSDVGLLLVRLGARLALLGLLGELHGGGEGGRDVKVEELKAADRDADAAEHVVEAQSTWRA